MLPTVVRTRLYDRRYNLQELFHQPCFHHLPPLTIEGYTLGLVDVKRLLSRLRDTDHTVIDLLKTQCTSAELDAFALALLDIWHSGAVSSNETWLLECCSWLGSEAVVPHLIAHHQELTTTTLFHQTDYLLRRVLGQHGSQAALFYLLRLWLDESRYSDDEFIRQAAERQHTTPYALAEAAIPAIEISDYTFQLQHRYDLVIAREMQPALRDPQGKLWYDLPQVDTVPTELYQAEQQRWQAVQGLILDVRALWLIILEQAMIDERRWQYEEFKQRFLENPLQRQLAQTLIWGVYDSKNKLKKSFRIAEDYTLATVEDEALPKLPKGQLGIVHPLHLSDAERAAWSELLHDYKFVQPFPQIGRGLYALTADELSHATRHLKRNDGTRLEPRWGELKRLGLHPLSGWRWHIPRFSRRFAQNQIYAHIVTDYDSRLQHMVFQSSGEEIPVQSVPPLVISEVLFTVQKLSTHEATP